MRKHGMEIIKVEHSETIDHCPNCPYAEKVQGLFDAYRCSQGVLEGPLYERDGCNLLGWVQSGRENYDAVLEVTACSTILGEELEPKATPKIEPELEPETAHKKGTLYPFNPGEEVVLLPWESYYDPRDVMVHYPTNMDRKLFGRVGHYLWKYDQARIRLSVDDSCWWPIEALRPVSLKKELQPYPDLGRLPQVGEEVEILNGIDKGRHGTVLSVVVCTARVEYKSGARFNYLCENLAPLDQ